MFDVTYIFLSQYVSSLSFLSLWFDRKVFQLLFTDGIVPQLNSIRTDPWFVFLSIFGVVVLLYPSYSQMTSWFLIRFYSIQSDTSPNTRHHRSQLSPDPDFTSDLTRKLSRAEVLEHMSSSNRFHRNENFQSEKDCITSSFSIFPDVKLCSVNSKSSVKRELTADTNSISRLRIYIYIYIYIYTCWRHIWRSGDENATNDMFLHGRLKSRLGRFHASPSSMETIR